MYAYGYHYPTSITATTASLKKNPYYFLAPILGEVDWRWNWQGTAKPRNGFFKVDILDIVKCTAAYCTQGNGVYDPLYLPNADLDSTDLGHIGLLDLVTVTSKYAQKSQESPP